ncbi:hypothetical protein RA19_00280 [Leisingera sp. ANG-M1]|uniref:hypothetical protein n=1 Tax=Leisingera sp. ANG-M1 TaxID=1577895 RepID=UPI00057CC284|nr:hypothetical protein [Leisingera sp. ANG-M1]KIC12878.1 hypothetical protein RA19_00280 [Leisingera sp. ANG-M1]
MTALIRPASFQSAGACTAGRTVQGAAAGDPLMELFEHLKRQEAAKDREAERLAAMIGDNGGPPLVEPFGISAPWFQFANAEEVERLAKLHVRIERRQLILSDDIGERTKIMNRCIRRMRRAAGKS